MYATRNGENRPVTRHQTKEARKQTVGVLWCPFCDRSNQDDRDQCGGCEAVFVANSVFDPVTTTTSEENVYIQAETWSNAPVVIHSRASFESPESYHTPETEPAADPATGMNEALRTCPDCQKVLKSPAGVRLHQRHAHKDEHLGAGT
jgi:hypothetical protein